jgi:hypothetical protein
MHRYADGFQGGFRNSSVRLPFLVGEFLTESRVLPCLSVLGVTNGDGAFIANIALLGGIWGLKARKIE